MSSKLIKGPDLEPESLDDVLDLTFTFMRNTGVMVEPDGAVTYYANRIKVSREDYLAIVATHHITGWDLTELLDQLLDHFAEILTRAAATQVGDPTVEDA